MRFIAYISCLLLIPYLTIADTITKPITCKPTVYILYANGMDNSKERAKENLKSVLTSKLPDENKTLRILFPTKNSGIAYNYDSTLILELLEIYQQKKYERLDLFWDWFFDATDAPEWFREAIKKVEIRLPNNRTHNKNIEELVAQYESILEQGFAILTVAHSQGNLFTNSIYDHLLQNSKNQEKLAMVSVATPASRVSAGGPYVTLYSDGIINILAKYFMGGNAPLPPNQANTHPKPGLWDHQFIKHYLNGIPSGQRIKTYIKEQKEKLEKNKKVPKQDIPQECIDRWNKLKDEKMYEDCELNCIIQIQPPSLSNLNCARYCDYLCCRNESN